MRGQIYDFSTREGYGESYALQPLLIHATDDAVLFRTEDYSGENGQPLQVFDWAGEPLCTYPKVSDFRISGDALYLLAAKPTRLLRVPVESFTQPADIATAEIRMFGDEGTIRWEAPNFYYDEGEGFRAEYGDGFFRLQGDGTVLFRMNAMGDSWTNTGDLTLTRR